MIRDFELFFMICRDMHNCTCSHTFRLHWRQQQRRQRQSYRAKKWKKSLFLLKRCVIGYYCKLKVLVLLKSTRQVIARYWSFRVFCWYEHICHWCLAGKGPFIANAKSRNVTISSQVNASKLRISWHCPFKLISPWLVVRIAYFYCKELCGWLLT